MDIHMLTTVDNPYDPFTQFDEWNAWDVRAGYHSLALIGRLLFTSAELSDAEQQDAFESVLQEIMDENVTGVYTLVTEGTVPRAKLSA